MIQKLLILLSKIKKAISFVGVAFIIEGILLFLDIRIIGKMNIEPTFLNAIVSLSIGISFICIGYLLPSENSIEYSKCPKCLDAYTYNKLKDGICPKCNIKTIDMENYYNKSKKVN